jgi:hypothetical protein
MGFETFFSQKNFYYFAIGIFLFANIKLMLFHASLPADIIASALDPHSKDVCLVLLNVE